MTMTPPLDLPAVTELALANRRDISALDEKLTDLATITRQAVDDMARQMADAYARFVQQAANVAEADRAAVGALTATVSDLTDSHARLQEAVAVLATAQTQTSASNAALQQAVAALNRSAAQAQTNENVAALSDTVASLAEAQTQTNENVAALSDTVAGLAEAQTQTNENVAALRDTVAGLAEAQAQTNENVAALRDTVASLAEAQAQTNENVAALRDTVASLAAAQAQTDANVAKLQEAVAALTEAQTQTNKNVAALEDVVAGLTKAQTQANAALATLSGRMANISGSRYERFVSRIGSRHIRRVLGLTEIKLVHRAWGDGDPVIDDAINSPEILDQDAESLGLVDAIFRGRNRHGDQAYVVVEISITALERDVTRAARGARTLACVTGQEAIPAVIGTIIADTAEKFAQREDVAFIPIPYPETQDG